MSLFLTPAWKRIASGGSTRPWKIRAGVWGGVPEEDGGDGRDGAARARTVVDVDDGARPERGMSEPKGTRRCRESESDAVGSEGGGEIGEEGCEWDIFKIGGPKTAVAIQRPSNKGVGRH